MTTKRMSIALAGTAATALLATAPCLASPKKSGNTTKTDKAQTYLVVTLDTVYVSSN
jgi:hypothetical protein